MEREDLFANKLIVRKGEVITSSILERSDLGYKNINIQIQSLIRKTRDQIKLKGSIVSEITTRGDFVNKLRDSLQSNQNMELKLEVVSLRDCKTAEPILVELNINRLK